MRKCKAEVTIPPGKRHWFTEQEAAWVLSSYTKWLGLPTGRSAVANKKRDDFYHDLAKRFCKQFPYRDLVHNQNWSYTEEQKRLEMTDDDRGKLHSRFGDKFRHHRRTLGKAAPAASSTRSPNASVKSGAAESVPSPPGTSDGEGSADMPREPGPSGEQRVRLHQATGDDAETGSSGALSDPRGLGTRYETSEQDQADMERALLGPQETTGQSWAAIGDDELRERQNSIVVTLQTVLKVIERATGAELHAMALWHNGEAMRVCSCSTDRLSGFDETSEAELCRSTFIEYAQQRLG
ncbi:hypothetical protein FS749_006552 [Ceratobasidium sp. UAMH 11750]|nr:hypothetical protein FS749_006552 [Ceratobasidium sp. UAMH 11750]